MKLYSFFKIKLLSIL